MAREKQKPEFTIEELGVNPLAQGLSVLVTKKTQQVLNKYKEVDEKIYEYETTNYTKVFQIEGSTRQVVDLQIRCQQLYLWLIHAISPATDYIWIDKSAYMKKMDIKSINTYKAAINNMCLAGYISKHITLKDVYWINPRYFFKGSRLNKYPDCIVVKNELK